MRIIPVTCSFSGRTAGTNITTRPFCGKVLALSHIVLPRFLTNWSVNFIFAFRWRKLSTAKFNAGFAELACAKKSDADAGLCNDSDGVSDWVTRLSHPPPPAMLFQ